MEGPPQRAALLIFPYGRVWGHTGGTKLLCSDGVRRLSLLCDHPSHHSNLARSAEMRNRINQQPTVFPTLMFLEPCVDRRRQDSRADKNREPLVRSAGRSVNR